MIRSFVLVNNFASWLSTNWPMYVNNAGASDSLSRVREFLDSSDLYRLAKILNSLLGSDEEHASQSVEESARESDCPNVSDMCTTSVDQNDVGPIEEEEEKCLALPINLPDSEDEIMESDNPSITSPSFLGVLSPSFGDTPDPATAVKGNNKDPAFAETMEFEEFDKSQEISSSGFKDTALER